MQNRYIYFIKNITLFFISYMFPKLISLVLVPLYTSKLSTEDVGIYENSWVTAALLIPILTFCIKDAVLRFCLDDNSSNKQIFCSALLVEFFSIIIVGIMSIIFIANNMESFIYVFLIFSSQAFLCFVISFCRGIEKIKIITVSSIINSSITLLANLIILVLFDYGLSGLIAANVVGALAAITYIIIAAKLWKYIGLYFNKHLLWLMIKYGSPMIISSIMYWLNTASNRYVLTLTVGLSASGIYGVACKIPNFIGTLQTVFNDAWQISAVKEYDNKDSNGFLSKMYSFVFTLTALVCSLLIVLNKPISAILFQNDFAEAYIYVSPLYLSMLFLMISNYYDGLYISLKKTKIIGLAAGISAFVSLISCLTFTTFFGIIGAAYATLFANFVCAIIKILISKKYFVFKKSYITIFATIFTIVVQVVLCQYGFHFSFVQFGLFFLVILFNIKTIIACCKLLIDKSKSYFKKFTHPQ